MWPRKKKQVAPEISTRKVTFVGEQDGKIEQELKFRLVDCFRGGLEIRSSYLARVTYHPSGPTSVALCLSGVPKKMHRTVVESAGKIFASIFSDSQHLDIIFLSDDQERKAAAVCRAFYFNRAASN